MLAVEVIFATITLPVIVCFSNSVDVKEKLTELCLWEAFKPECSSNEVVFVDDAKYGRMRIGKCLAQSEIDDFGSQSMDHKVLGCYHDVTAFVGRNCSLEKQCELKVGILEQLKNTECSPGLKMHLEVKYSCLPVIDQFTTGCHTFLTGSSKYLSITPRNNILCGTETNPLMVEVSKGQRISLTMKPLKEIEAMERLECQRQIGIIIDRKSQTNASLCDNGIYNPSTRSPVTNGYISKENHVSVIFNRFERNYKVLLEMKADGCLDIIPPEDTWLKRTNDDIVIGCYSSKQTWYLRCENGQWTGSIGNCSNPDTFKLKPGQNTPADKDDVTKNEKLTLSSTQQTLIIVAIGAFGVIVCLAIVCLGTIYLKRMAHKQGKSQSHYCDGMNFYGNSGYGHFNQLQKPNGFTDQSMASSTFNKQSLPFMSENADLDGDGRYQVLDKDEVAKECAAFK